MTCIYWGREDLEVTDVNIMLKRIHEMGKYYFGLCQMWEAGGINKKARERSSLGGIERESLRAGES